MDSYIFHVFKEVSSKSKSKAKTPNNSLTSNPQRGIETFPVMEHIHLRDVHPMSCVINMDKIT